MVINGLNTSLRHRIGRAAVLSLLALALAPCAWMDMAVAQARPGAHDKMKAEAPPLFPDLDRLKHVEAGDLDVAYAELGPADGTAVILLHGWPYDIRSYEAVAPALAARGFRVLIPYARGFGETRFRSADTARNAEPAALAHDVTSFMDALGIEQAVLGGFDWGARSADIVAALWPHRVKALVTVSGYLISSQDAGDTPLSPDAELGWWYQFYFATERGRAGYNKNRHAFAKLIWQLASPKWKFDEAVFAQSAAALDNPDHVEIVIHNYRWRLGLVKGEARYATLETRLAALPSIGVPTIALEGDANGAPHPPGNSYAKRFTGPYEFRQVEGGVGHNLPQEAPQAFVRAIVDANRL